MKIECGDECFLELFGRGEFLDKEPESKDETDGWVKVQPGQTVDLKDGEYALTIEGVEGGEYPGFSIGPATGLLVTGRS